MKSLKKDSLVNEEVVVNENGSEKSYLNIFGKKQSKSPLVFILQTSLVFIVVITSLVNLSINSLSESDKKLWIVLLSSCVGYILPNPSVKLPIFNNNNNN
jgi:hypothetical protein